MFDSSQSRRDFLHSTACLLGAMTAFGLPAKAMWALPVTMTEGSGTGHEKTYPIPAADGISIDRSAQIILVRYQAHVFAFALSCPHENAAVKWVEKESRFQCTKHNSRYQPDGVYTSGRATRNMDRFPIRREGTTVVIDADHVFQSDKDAAGWAAASVAV